MSLAASLRHLASVVEAIEPMDRDSVAVPVCEDAVAPGPDPSVDFNVRLPFDGVDTEGIGVDVQGADVRARRSCSGSGFRLHHKRRVG